MTNRFSPSFFVSLFLLTVFTSACIIVVEEDDDRRRRYIHGSEWTLEVVFYRTETIQAADRDVTVSFSEDGRLTGTSRCGDFSANYTLEENDGFSITNVTHTPCSDIAMTRVFLDQLDAVNTAKVTDVALEMGTSNNGRMAFTKR